MRDEQKENDRFIRLVGVKKADRLQYIWNTSYPHGFQSEVPKETEFLKRAKDEGFTDKQIDAFLKL